MSVAVPIPLRTQPNRGFASLDNVACDVFLPIIGPTAFSIYATLLRRSYGDPRIEYGPTELATRVRESRATIARHITVLQTIGMIEVEAGRGNRKAKCIFKDLKALAEGLGPPFQKATGS